MNVASLELSKELFELSGWDTEHEVVYRMEKGKSIATNAFDKRAVGTLPQYDLGYLLRKFVGNGGVEIRYGDKGCTATSHVWTARAETPEDATVLLAIHHFKQGIFKDKGQQ